MLSLTLVFCAASCLHVVLLYVWLNARPFWFWFPFAAGPSVIVSGLMAFTDPDLALDLAELWAYKPASQESMSTNFISGAVEPMAVPDDFPVTLPHVDESSAATGGGDGGPDGPPGQPKTRTTGERSRKKGGIFRPPNWGHG